METDNKTNPNANGTQPEIKFLAIPVELAQAVLTYLVKCPYEQVFEMCDGMRRLQPAAENVPEPAKAKAV